MCADPQRFNVCGEKDPNQIIRVRDKLQTENRRIYQITLLPKYTMQHGLSSKITTKNPNLCHLVLNASTLNSLRSSLRRPSAWLFPSPTCCCRLVGSHPLDPGLRGCSRHLPADAAMATGCLPGPAGVPGDVRRMSRDLYGLTQHQFHQKQLSAKLSYPRTFSPFKTPVPPSLLEGRAEPSQIRSYTCISSHTAQTICTFHTF